MDEKVEAALMEAGARINALVENERRLIDELEKARKDAQRYRWLRDVSTATWRSFQEQWRMPASQCDAAIDERMQHKPAVGAA